VLSLLTRSSILALVLCGTLDAQEKKCTLVPQKPVYRVDDAEKVKFTLVNSGVSPVKLPPTSAWRIQKGTQVVYTPSDASGSEPLGPSESRSWMWNKRSSEDVAVLPGSYTIVVGPIGQGVSSYELKVDVALTPTGKLAGVRPMPLAKGNEWVFETGTATTTMRVTNYWAGSKWYQVSNFVGATRWCTLAGVTFPRLHTQMHPLTPTNAVALFRFGEEVGYTYPVLLESFEGGTKIRVGATQEGVETPAGAFGGCTRFDVVDRLEQGTGFISFWFAPGIGLVQYTKMKGDQRTLFRLRSARVRGDGDRVYTIGIKK